MHEIQLNCIAMRNPERSYEILVVNLVFQTFSEQHIQKTFFCDLQKSPLSQLVGV